MAHASRVTIHRVFAILSLVWAVGWPIQVLVVIVTEAAKAKTDAQIAGLFLGTFLGIFFNFFIWMMVLIPLVLIAVFTKTSKS